jgi:hypothetical protein
MSHGHMSHYSISKGVNSIKNSTALLSQQVHSVGLMSKECCVINNGE